MTESGQTHVHAGSARNGTVRRAVDAQSARRHIHVLLLDDQPLFSATLSEGLRRMAGFGTIHASRELSEALRSVALNAPDLAILDAALPRGGAFQAAVQVVAYAPACRLVFLDEQLALLRLREALRLFAAGYWTKQSSLSEFVAALRRVADGQTVFCPEAGPFVQSSASGWTLTPPAHLVGWERLTTREQDVLMLLAQGVSLRQAATLLGVTKKTADNHKARLLVKLGVHSQIELVRWAIREGLVPC
jgi:DNA-binding NarL/FixJ family response regulator